MNSKMPLFSFRSALAGFFRITRGSRAGSSTGWDQFMDAMPDMVFIIDNDCNVIKANKAALAAMGVTLKEVIGRKCHSVIHKVEAPLNNCPCKLSKKDKQSHSIEVFDPELKTPLLITNLPMFDADGVLTGAIHIVKDISEKKELENRMLQFHKMEALSRLAGGIAHEFNNILSVINSAFYMLKSRSNMEATDQEDVDAIQKAVASASSLTRHLLTLSQRQVLDIKTSDLNVLVRESVQIMSKLLGEKTKIESDLNTSPLKIHGDPSQINKLIMHIIIQAEPRTHLKRSVRIKTESVVISDFAEREHGAAPTPKNFARITIQDTAYEIKKELLANIFEPYFESTNMNLALAYGIARQHKGWIDVIDSGKTAAFEIYLPTTETDPGVTPTAAAARTQPQKNMRVLLAEDDEDLRAMTAKVIRKDGHTVFEADSAEKAMEIFNSRKGDFSALVSDVVMPDKSGVDLADSILRHSPGMKVILMSGYIDDKVHLDAIQQKGYKFIYKPFDVDMLLTMLKS